MKKKEGQQMFILGTIIILLAGGVLVWMIYSSIDSVLREEDEQRVKHLADKMFDDMLETATVRVRQCLVIRDEMH